MKYTPPNEFRELIDKLIDQPPLTNAEIETLEHFLENDTALLYYTEIMQQESLVAEALVAPQVAPRKSKSNVLHFIPIAWTAVACACFVIGILIGHFPNSEKHSEISSTPTQQQKPLPAENALNDEFLPLITGMFGVRWADEGENDSIIPTTNNTLQLESGIVELTYPNGVQVILEGPASFKASGGNGGSLGFGRLVASVPPGAEGFEVDYGHGKVVDLGTEFGMEVKKNGQTDVGVFDGKVQIHAPAANASTEIFSITENNALRHSQDSEKGVFSIPFNKRKFVRNAPSREFSWSITSLEMKELEFDVSHLIWRGARYRALFKWMHGNDAIEIHKVSLCKDGQPVVINKQLGSTGEPGSTHNNIFELALLDDDYSRAKWTIRALIAPKARVPLDKSFEENKPESHGIMQLIENMESNTTTDAFIGAWEYLHGGRKYVRVFNPDGTMNFIVSGKEVGTKNVFWTFEDNTLKLKFPHLNHTEDNVLLDENTLLFTNRPYANAVKVDGPHMK